MKIIRSSVRPTLDDWRAVKSPASLPASCDRHDGPVPHVTANLPTRMQDVVAESVDSLNKYGDAMNMHRDSHTFSNSGETLEPKKVGLLRRFFRLLIRILSSPKGDQGGWEGGARGL
jgi:hypothetical protein